METHVITIQLPLQIMDIGNGCEAYSASIYIPAKSELTATIHSVTRSQFFLNYNFNYTNVMNYLVWYGTDFANLTNEEIQNKNVFTSTAVSRLPQTPLDELLLPPILVPQLQMETGKPTTSTPLKSTHVKTGPLSLELDNHAAADLDQKGEFQKYRKFLQNCRT